MAETGLQCADSALEHIGLRADALPAVQHGRFHAIPQVLYQQRSGPSKAHVEKKVQNIEMEAATFLAFC